MEARDFINIVREVVKETSVNDIIENLEEPSGRQPDKKLVELSKWFNTLDAKEREYLQTVIEDSVNSSIFGFLCVIDGVRAIENDENKGHIELYFVKDGNRVLINDPSKEFLHDVFNEAE